MPTTAPLNGLVIGQTERAVRALLERLLARTGRPFEQWTAINLTAGAGGSTDRAGLVRTLAAGLRVEPAVTGATVADLVALDLLTETGTDVALTAAGRAEHDRIQAGIDQISARLYGDLPPAELTIAASVLTTVTARARAELG
jgi:hypothetical protein